MTEQSQNRDDQERADYRAALAIALNQARQFDGKEASADKILEATVEFEAVLKRILEVEGSQVLAADEILAASVFHRVAEHTSIDGILDEALDAYRRKLTREVSRIEIKRKVLNSVFFPPEEGGSQEGEAQESSSRRVVRRLPLLLPALMKAGIYADDVILIEGTVSGSQWRNEPYQILEIPRLNCQILFCDQVGEQTYVVGQILDYSVYKALSKKELMNSYPGLVTPVRFTDSYAQNVCDEAFVDRELGEKLDLERRDLLIAEVKRQFPDPKAWVAMSHNDRRNLNFLGGGLHSLANGIGVNEVVNPHSFVGSLRLARCIYGFDNSLLRERELLERGDPAEWKKILLLEFPNPKTLLDLSVTQFPRVKSYSLRVIVVLLGLSTSNFDLERMLALAEFLFPEDESVLAFRKKVDRNREITKAIENDIEPFLRSLRLEHPDPIALLDLGMEKIETLKVLDASMHRLVNHVTGQTAMIYAVFLDFLIEVYAKTDYSEQLLERKRLEALIDNPDLLSKEIRRRWPNLTDWPYDQKKAETNLKLGKYRVKYIYKTLGITGVKTERYLNFLIEIYKDQDLTDVRKRLSDYKAIESERNSLGKSKALWSSKLLAEFTSYEEWMKPENVGFHARRRKQSGRSLKWIAKNVYGMTCEGTTISPADYETLGRMIFESN